MSDSMNPRPLISAGLLLGVGLGGFFDGILFHQILQIHNMLSAVLPKINLVNAEINMFWDGLFHAFTWFMTVFGLGLLWKAVRRSDVPLSTRTLVGAMIGGWGVFNFVEGIIDHHLLQLHHVYEAAGQSVWDYLFLLSGIVFMITGWRLIRTAAQTPDPLGRTSRPAYTS